MAAAVISEIVPLGQGAGTTLHFKAACASCGWVSPSKSGGPGAEARAQAKADAHDCEKD